MVCLGFMLGGSCAYILVGGGEFFPSGGQGCVEVVCLGVSVESLSADD